MYLRTLTVLMWRHWLARQREFILTFIELLVPVLPFVLIYVFRKDVFEELPRASALGAERLGPIALRSTYGPPCVLYTPETNFTRTLMDLVGRKLNLRPLKTLDINARGYFSFNNSSAVSKYAKNMRPDEAIVVFHNVKGVILPSNLNYSIRMNAPLKMHELLAEREDIEIDRISVRDNGRVRQPFLRLQWAIDTSFIQMLTGKKVKQKMTLQELPQAKYFPKIRLVKANVLILAAKVAVMPVFFTFMLRLMIEKASGIQELMKMAGVTTCTLVTSHILNALLPGLVYAVGATVLLKHGPSAVLLKSNGFLIFLALFLQFVVIIFVALVGSNLARKVSPTALTVLTIYILMTLPSSIMRDKDLSNMIYLWGLIPFMPLIWILKEAGKLEEFGSGLTLTTIMKAHTPTTVAASWAYLYFFLQIILCLALFWYFDHVIPSIYGTTHPWYFPFQKSYWFTAVPELESDKSEMSAIKDQNPEYFEPPPDYLEPGIEVYNVTKIYSKVHALDNVTLDVYRGEITALLGHNGAGKSTLMSVITGMTNATRGRVLVNGLDTSLEKTLARRQMGLCPQRDIFLKNVSLIEHLNRGTFKEARKSSEDLLAKLNLKKKAGKSISSLSGGMKRRAQLACALAGQPDVLLLDEPTSGLDVESRRLMWDLLLSLRGSRTVLMSTHFMEEADALADRVVALHTGQLYCHATPMHLKRALGTGYRLTFTTSGEPDEPEITSVIRSVVPEATIKEIGYGSISYILPFEYRKRFPTLFSRLESRKSELGIDSIGVGTNTLEEVFLKLFSNVITDPLDEDDFERDKELKHKKRTGALLYINQTLALIKRYLRFIWVYKITQIGFGIIPIVAIIIFITLLTNDAKKPRRYRSLVTLNLDMYTPSLDYRIVYNINGTESDLRPLSDQYPRIHFENASDIGKAVLRDGRQNHNENCNYLAGIELNDTEAKVFYTKVHHIAPVALNLLSNLVVTRSMPWASGRTITAHYHPLPGAYTANRYVIISLPKNYIKMRVWLFVVTLMLLSGFTFMIQLPSMEARGARHLHVLAGCSPELHWISMLLAGTLQVVFVYIPTLVVACAFFDYDNTFTDWFFIIAISVVVLLSSMAMLAFSYHLTFFCNQSLAVGFILIVIVFSMLVFPPVLLFVSAAADFELAALILLPPYTFSRAMIRSATAAFLNALCRLNRDKCWFLAFILYYFDGGRCCRPIFNPLCFFCFDYLAPAKQMLYLVAQIFMYMTIVIVIQRGTFKMVEEKIKNCWYKEPEPRCDDESVEAEREYVEEAISELREEDNEVYCCEKIPDVMLVSNLHKNYRGWCCGFKAVKGISFSVKKGECFGLLGVNGAGKSTVFSMLTAFRCPTKGRIFANGHELTFPYSTDYLYSLGYCPQFWNLDDFLTGYQTLKLLLSLNGSRNASTEAMAWIRLVGLEEYSDTVVSSYSGGCSRRLAAAAALCTGAPLTLLDEPTAGVDVAARRRVWFAVKRALNEERAVVISSHSLDEMEALCDRIAIMVAGEICALGSPAALRAAYASGHTIVMKIKYESTKHQRMDRRRTRYANVDLLKAIMKKKFDCTLKDEHKTMLHYHINKTMKYSKLFREMEHLQESLSGLIEDYSISETSLEEVFLSFTKPPDLENEADDLA